MNGPLAFALFFLGMANFGGFCEGMEQNHRGKQFPSPYNIPQLFVYPGIVLGYLLWTPFKRRWQ